ncbi:hypothetical protein CBR_g27977 [Chara braunii]|uniref:Reverse transcriptase RNase H-like domain-containing protein n=1 Tax=Chara braunii TaxID=69332 RepID=A0A388L983_CHABU|nr:hypothetical protein CBR_g27977 [Chara braunii]|eukprot:GBG78753.1 hypothetical protein CBR_g27977 [Chara braunii]
MTRVDNFKFTLKKHYRSDGSVDDIAKGCKVAGEMFGGYGRRAMSLPYFVPLAPGHDEAVHVTDFLEVGRDLVPLSVPWTSDLGHRSVVLLGSREESALKGGWEVRVACQLRLLIKRWACQTTRRTTIRVLLRNRGFMDLAAKVCLGSRRHVEAAMANGCDRAQNRRLLVVWSKGLVRSFVACRWPRFRLEIARVVRRFESGNVAGEEEVSEQGLFRERSAEKTQSGGKRNLPNEEEREGIGALKRQRKVGGSARTPTTREGGSVEKRKRVGGGDETPKDSSTQRRTGESSGKRSKSSRGKKADEGDSGEGDDDVEINLNAFNLDNAFFLEMQTGVQKDIVLHIYPERILVIPDWEDAYNRRSLDEFLVDTIASAMIDCYERKDMRYTKPIFVLAPIVAPPENGEPAVRVLPADFDSSQTEKYWYYPMCGQHNARAAMTVEDHPVFEYYNFCKWPFRPIYFPDDEFDGYAHVSGEDNIKDKNNPPLLQVLSMRDIHNIWKIKGKLRVVLGNASKKKDEVRKWVQFMALAMKKTPYTSLWNLSTEEKKRKEWAEKLRYYLPLAMVDDSVVALGEKLYEEWSKGKLLASDGRRCTEKAPTHEEVAKPGLSTVTDSQGLKKHVCALTTLVQFNVDLLSVIDHKEALGKLGHQLRSHTCVLDLCGTVDRAQWDSGAFASLSELLGFVCQDYWTLVVFVPCLWNLSFMTSLSALGATRCYTGKWVWKTAAKKTHQFGNNVWEEPDVMHIVFKGEDPRLLTHPVYEGAVAEDVAAALQRKQKVTPTHVEEKSFKSLTFADIGNLTQRGALYKDSERNPNQLCNQLFFFCSVADAMLFLGKPHAQVVWSLLQHGRHVLAVDGDTTQLEYTVQYVTHEDVVDLADFTLDYYKLAFGEEDDFNIETEKEESVEDDLFDLDGQLAIFNAQVSASPSVCKPGTPLATPTSGSPTPVSSSAPVKWGGLSRLRSSPGEPIRLTPQPERLRPGHPVPPDHPHLKAPATPFHMGNKHTFSTAEDWGHDIVWHPDHFQPVLLDGKWAVAVRDVSGGWIYDNRWDLETFKSRAYDAVLERLSEVNRRSKDDPALREYGDTVFDLLQLNKWLEVSSAFYALPSSPSIKQVSWELPAGTPLAGVVTRKSRGKDDKGDGEGGGQRGTGGGSEQRLTKQRSPGHAGGGEGKKGSREKKKPRSGEKTKHHTGDGQGSDVDCDEDGGVLAVTGSTSMETGNDFRPGWITRPGEQNPVISSTSATQYTDVVGGEVVAKNGTCFAQLLKRLVDCLGSIRTSEMTSSSGTQCLPGSETTTYHGSGSDKLQPCSVSPQKKVQINPNREASTVERAQRSPELERVVRVFENPGGEIRIHPNQEDVSAMTDDRCQDAVMLCMEVHKELQADCPTEGELATSFNVQPRTLGAECLVTVCAELTALSDSPVKVDTSSPLETAGARMNPNKGPVSMSLPDAGLETTVIQIHPRHTDEGLDGCRLLTTLDKDDSADDRIDPTLGDIGMEQPVQLTYDDPLYSGLHDEAMGEDVLKKSSDAVGDRFLYLSDEDKDTAHEDKKLRGGEVLLDIHGTLSTTQCDTVATEETQPVDVVDVDALCPDTDKLKLPVADVEDFRHRDGDEFMSSPVIEADISNLSSFPVSLEHVVAASRRTGAPIVLGLPSVGFGDVEAKPVSSCKRNYCAPTGECYAALWGICHFRAYLYGRKFTLVTDHEPLLALKKSKDYLGMIERWATTLQSMDFDIRYRKHEKHDNAGGMTRLHRPDKVPRSEEVFPWRDPEPKNEPQYGQVEILPKG